MASNSISEFLFSINFLNTVKLSIIIIYSNTLLCLLFLKPYTTIFRNISPSIPIWDNKDSNIPSTNVLN